MAKPATPPMERLSARLRRERNGCWVFTGTLNKPGGYGLVYDADRKGNVYTHRLVFEHHHGPVPPDMHVCHRCDNPPCCNPDHLFLGTRKDNAQDSVAKGRNVRGERHGAARLTASDVRAIRAEHAAGRSCYSLAQEYGVNAPHAERIVARKAWKHIT